MRRSGPVIDVEKLGGRRAACRQGRVNRGSPFFFCPQSRVMLIRRLSAIEQRSSTTSRSSRRRTASELGRIETYSVMLLKAGTYISHIPTLLLAKSIYFFSLLASLCDDEISTIYTVIII